MWTWGYILQQAIVGSGLIWSLYMLYASFMEILDDDRRAKRHGATETSVSSNGGSWE